MAKVKPVGDANGRIGYSFWCPACNYHHIYYVERAHSNGSIWTFNGDFKNPSFTPSLLIRTGIHADPNWEGPGDDIPRSEWIKPGWSDICHLYVTNGVINYCSDCTHEYNGKHGIEMKDIE